VDLDHHHHRATPTSTCHRVPRPYFQQDAFEWPKYCRTQWLSTPVDHDSFWPSHISRDPPSPPPSPPRNPPSQAQHRAPPPPPRAAPIHVNGPTLTPPPEPEVPQPQAPKRAVPQHLIPRRWRNRNLRYQHRQLGPLGPWFAPRGPVFFDWPWDMDLLEGLGMNEDGTLVGDVLN
jgi:hypothetical protein